MTILSEIFVLFKIFFTYVQIWGYETECNVMHVARSYSKKVDQNVPNSRFENELL